MEKVKIRLMFDGVLTTMDFSDKNGIKSIIPDSRQTVVAVGPGATVKVGDEVEINFARFPVQRSAPKLGIGPDTSTIILPNEFIDGKEYMYISMREIKWVYLKEDETI